MKIKLTSLRRKAEELTKKLAEASKLSESVNDLANELEALMSESEIESPEIESKPRKKLHIILGAGHGGMKDGNYMTNPQDGKFYTFTDVRPSETSYEGVINRQLADAFFNLARKSGFGITKAYHPYQDLPLQDVSLIENQTVKALTQGTPTIYISIHHNAHGMANKGASQPANGWCCFVNKNQATGLVSKKGYEYASIIEKNHRQEFQKNKVNLAFRDLGDFASQKQAIWLNSTWWELRATTSPAILIEGGFFTNYKDFKQIESKEYINASSNALLNSCLEIESKL